MTPSFVDGPSAGLKLHQRALGSPVFWSIVVMVVAAIPVAGGFLPGRVFHVRDLSLFFWSRHIWLRRALLSGEWPLWDPFLGAGQSAVADALNQMFLFPALVLRLLGSERIGFNLWVAAPFPIAALGMYRFLTMRFSTRAAAVGALAFGLCGPVVSGGNFPNSSWSVAAMPWVMWAVDRALADTRHATSTVVLAAAFGLQAVSGEPVTLAATGLLALAYAMVVGAPHDGDVNWRRWLAGTGAVLSGLVLGGLLAAVQLVPLEDAVRGSWRSAAIAPDFWSLHPLGLAETIAVHLFGDYFNSPNFLVLPWMTPLNSGRDPFFFSIYLGPTLLGMAVFGAVAGWSKRWSTFWVAACVIAVLAAAGPYTPFYPFLRAHLPLVNSFRFPVKYLVIAALGIASLAAAAWDGLAQERRRLESPGRYRAARVVSVTLLLALASVGYVLGAAAVYWPDLTARAAFSVANAVGVVDPVAGAAFMLGTLPGVTARLVLLALAAALFLGVASSRRKETALAQVVLFLLLATDLVAAAWNINPTAHASVLAEPSWISIVRAHPETRFYFGGKVDGTFQQWDPDGPKAFIRPFDVPPAEARSAISNLGAFYPAGRAVREMFSYDLTVLWPRPFQLVHQRFLELSPADRARFLDRLGVRYRLLWKPAAGERTPVVTLPHIREMALYDFGTTATRVAVVPRWETVSDLRAQIDRLFTADIDPTRVVLLSADPPAPAGSVGLPDEPGARIVQESSHTVIVDASAGVGGGILRLLDTYSPDWKVTVDGRPAPLLRADVLFRAVALAPGRHRVEFRYRPRPFYVGAAISLLALGACAILVRRRVSVLPIGTSVQRASAPAPEAGDRRAVPQAADPPLKS